MKLMAGRCRGCGEVLSGAAIYDEREEDHYRNEFEEGGLVVSIEDTVTIGRCKCKERGQKALAILAGIGAEEFKAQRIALYEVIEAGGEWESRLAGLDTLLEYIADFCHDELGMDTILTEEDGPELLR